MCKLISLIIILSFYVSPAFSQNIQGNVQNYSAKSKIMEPEFSEFAPVGYLDRKHNSETITSVEKVFGKVFIFSLIGIPVGALMLENVKSREKNNLWADRKQNFESSLRYCQASETEKDLKSCYNKIRRVELYKNADKKTIRLNGAW